MQEIPRLMDDHEFRKELERIQEHLNAISTGVQTKTTLAPALGAVTAFSMGKNLQTGEVEAIEMGNQIPGQMSVNDVPGVVPENVVEVEGKAVDTDTGEIVGTAGSKVVDLRRREA